MQCFKKKKKSNTFKYMMSSILFKTKLKIFKRRLSTSLKLYQGIIKTKSTWQVPRFLSQKSNSGILFFWMIIKFIPIYWIPHLYNEHHIIRLPPDYQQAISLPLGQVRKWPTICGRSNFSPLSVCCFLKWCFTMDCC